MRLAYVASSMDWQKREPNAIALTHDEGQFHLTAQILRAVIRVQEIGWR